MNVNIPCKDCLMIPVCKNKKYIELFRDCSLIKKHIPYYRHAGRGRDESIYELQRLLNPSQWYFEMSYDNYVLINEVRGNDSFKS